jgi:hypothetical protein
MEMVFHEIVRIPHVAIEKDTLNNKVGRREEGGGRREEGEEGEVRRDGHSRLTSN